MSNLHSMYFRRCRLLTAVLAAGLMAAALFLLPGGPAEPAFADDHKVTTIHQDHYVYCGGIYDLEVKPEKDAKGKSLYTPNSYKWKVKIKTDPKTYSSDLSDIDNKDWFYDTNTRHLKLNTATFRNGSDDDDWGLLRFYCRITDTKGTVHWSEDFTMHIGSVAEFRQKWKEDSDTQDAVTLTKVSPAADGSVKHLTMKTGEKKKFSFQSHLNAPYWLQESDPYLKNTIGICNSDLSVSETIEGSAYTFKPAKAGEYLVMLSSGLRLGRDYDPYFVDSDGPAQGMGQAQVYHITVTDKGTSAAEDSRTLVRRVPIALRLGTNDLLYKQIPAAGRPIPVSAVYPTTEAKTSVILSDSSEDSSGQGGWYKRTDAGWESCRSLGETSFQAGGTYRYQVTATARDGYRLDPRSRSADETFLRCSVIYDGKSRYPDQTFEPSSGESTSQKVIYVIRSFTVPETTGAADPTPAKTDVEPAMKKDLTEDAVITGLEDLIYDGSKQTPPVSVTCYGAALTQGTDYSISYSSNKDVGTAIVTVSGTGAYTGQAQAAFDILPKGREISKVTAARKALTVKWSKQSEKMSKDRITGYQIRYSKNADMSDAKTVTVKSYKSTSRKLTKLSAKTAYYVQLRTYMKKGGIQYDSPWSEAKEQNTK